VKFTSAVAKTQFVALSQESLPQEIIDYVAPKYREQFVEWVNSVTWSNSCPFPIPADMTEKFGHVRAIDAIIEMASPWFDSQQVKAMLATKVDAVKTALDNKRQLDRESRLATFKASDEYTEKAQAVEKWHKVYGQAKAKYEQAKADLESAARDTVDQAIQLWGDTDFRFADMDSGPGNVWAYAEIYPTTFTLGHKDLGKVRGTVTKTKDDLVRCEIIAKGKTYIGTSDKDASSPPYNAVKAAFLAAYADNGVKKVFSYNVKHQLLGWYRWRVDADGNPVDDGINIDDESE